MDHDHTSRGNNSTAADILRKQLGKDRVLTGNLIREIYARDASYFDIKPAMLVRARSFEDVSAIVAAARSCGTCVTFRAGGTSLSGQSVNRGIICELRNNFRQCEVRDSGKKVWFEPGLTASQVNRILRPHHHKLGPDPASSSAAMMGGILSNNSSGMEAGVRYNSYHMLRTIEFMLPSGNCYNTALTEDRRRFEREERELCHGLMQIRKEILDDNEIAERIRRKYLIKNVTGYSMNSFIDYDNPMDIFAHLLIGSEGTLAYIISAELATVPLYSHYTSSMLYFDDVTSAAASARWLGESGALAVEIMDYASLRSVPGHGEHYPKGATAMLVDYGADSSEHLADIVGRAADGIRNLKGLFHQDDFTHTVEERQKLWKIRDGIFPCVAGARIPESTVVLEDVVAPVGELDRLVEGVQGCFAKHGYKGAIFGHARDGNIHPLVTPLMKRYDDKENFARFIDDFVECVLRLDGSLKGEHGTGRAMAPFVAREWGEKIYSMMCRVKKLADPDCIFNPGVIINDDPNAHMHPMKSMDIFGAPLGYDQADKCMECGYCEHVCPSRALTLTPRQRLQARRIIARAGDPKLEKEYHYIGNETCCVDGSCQLPCPMGINTGTVTDAIRVNIDATLFEKALSASASRYGTVVSSIRGVLKAAVAAEKVVSPYPLIWAADFMHRIYNQVPHWSKYFPFPAKLHWREPERPDYIYFPACITRIFGGSTLGKDDLIKVIVRLGDRAGYQVAVPKEVHGLCCSQIWEHKGDPEGQKLTANKTVEAFWRLSREGRIPVVCDTTSCTHTLITLGKKEVLTEENREHYDKIRILDITQWLEEDILPRLNVTARKKRVLLHPTCAARVAGLDKSMERIAAICSEDYVMPSDAHCCGAAGDRGFIFPEISYSAVKEEREDIGKEEFDGCYSLARTCEISMQSTIERPYESIAYLVDETTSSK